MRLHVRRSGGDASRALRPQIPAENDGEERGRTQKKASTKSSIINIATIMHGFSNFLFAQLCALVLNRRSTPYDSPSNQLSPAKTALKKLEKNSTRTGPSRKIEVPAMAGAAVKTNPLLVQVQRESWGEGGAVEMSAFYGQRRNIRKTKEQEMISAIMELAYHGIMHPRHIAISITSQRKQN